jgi:hypothetical protein
MALTAECSACHKKYLVDDRAFGRKLRCKGCGHVFVVEAPRAAAPAPAEPEDPFAALVANQLDDIPDEPAVPAARSFQAPAPVPLRSERSQKPREKASSWRGKFGRNSASSAVGVDNLTPWVLIAFVAVFLIAAVIDSVHAGKAGYHVPSVGETWLRTLLYIVLLFVLLGPAVFVGVLLTSVIFGSKMVDLSYLRACAVAALPTLTGFLILFAPESMRQQLFLVATLGVWVAVFLAMKFVFDLDWAGAAVGFVLSGCLLWGAEHFYGPHIVVPATQAFFPHRDSDYASTHHLPSPDSGDSSAPPNPSQSDSSAKPDPNAALADANRTKTEENLRLIGQAALQFSSSGSTGAFPGDPIVLVNQNALPAHCLNSPFQSPQKGGYQFWPGRFAGMPANVVLAYDKAEFARFKITHVLFVNGDVQIMAADAFGPALSQSDQVAADWQEDQAAKKRLAMATQTPTPGVSTPPTVPQPPKFDDFVSQFTAQKSDLVASITPVPLEGEVQEIVRTLSPSPWIGVVKSSGPAEDTVELWDVNAAQKKGQASFVHELGSSSGYAINTTGTTIARIVHFPKLVVKVWSIKDNKEARTIILNDKFGEPALAGFLNADKLAVRWTLAGQEGLEIWDATTGQRGKQVPIEHFQRTANNGITSPDGRALALTVGAGTNGKPQIQMYDMLGSAGRYRWQNIADFDSTTAESPVGMAFSPDSKKVAALFTRNGISVILCWRFSDGKLLTENEIPLPPSPGAPGTSRGLDWVHDGAAWLVMGNLLVDSASGQTIGNLGSPPVSGQWMTGSDSVALTYEAEGQTKLAVVKLNGAKFPATTKPSH